MRKQVRRFPNLISCCRPLGGGWPSDKRDYSEINDMEALRHVLLLRVVNVAPAQFWQGDWDDQH